VQKRHTLGEFDLTSSAYPSLDAYAGMRYWFVDLDLQLDVTGAAASQLLGLSQAGALGIAKSGAIQWVDPVIGLRARHEFAPGQRFETRGDMGTLAPAAPSAGRSMGGYSRDFDVSGLKLTGSVGYRALCVDYSTTNYDGRQNGLNAILPGPVVSLGLRF
jgi:hypothetical protein